jgi:hypothetical protein
MRITTSPAPIGARTRWMPGLAPPLAGFEGATAVLRKPFELDVFLATVARLLGPPEE